LAFSAVEFVIVILVLVLWILLCARVGAISSRRGGSFAVGFLLAFLFSPLFGWLVVLILTPNRAEIERHQIRSGESKRCPQCSEVVKLGANVCRHCDFDFNAPDLAGGWRRQSAEPRYSGAPAVSFSVNQDAMEALGLIDKSKPKESKPTESCENCGR